MSVRIIPRLDIKGPNLVKGVHLEGLRVLGLPEMFAERYFRDGADELIFMDIVASLYGRNNLEAIIRRTASNVFIPITVGGGIRSIADIRTLLRAGADKVAINTAVTARPELITEAAEIFGSQCIVISIEAIQKGAGRWEAYTDNGREETGRDAVAWAVEAVDRGAGELLVTSVDREGTGLGYDIALIRAIADRVPVPVIACGGAGEAAHIESVFRDGHADAASAASILHYELLSETGIAKRDEGNVDYLKRFVASSGSILKNFKLIQVPELKSRLRDAGIDCANVPPHARNSDDESPAPQNTRPARVAVVDYDRNNLFSVDQALRSVGADVLLTSDPEEIATADGIVLTGVGAFGDGMQCLRDRGLVEALRAAAAAGKPILGICLGMQLLFSESEEFGRHEGLGLIPGKVTRLHPGRERAKVPHVGWNALRPAGSFVRWDECVLLDGLAEGAIAYFVHSYVAVPESPGATIATAEYGGVAFAAVVQHGSVSGTQFHPERSGRDGLRLLGNFVAALRNAQPAVR